MAVWVALGPETVANSTTDRNETPDSDPGPSGTLVVELRATVVADPPEDATVVRSTDDRIARVELFSELFDILDETADESDDSIVGETIVAETPYDSRAGSAVREVMKELPETEQSIDGAGRTGVYVEYEDHDLFVDSEVVRVHLD